MRLPSFGLSRFFGRFFFIEFFLSLSNLDVVLRYSNSKVNTVPTVKMQNNPISVSVVGSVEQLNTHYFLQYLLAQLTFKI